MPAAPEYYSLWGHNMTPFPRALLNSLGITDDSLPPGDEMPVEVPPVFSGNFRSSTPPMEMFAKINLTAERSGLDLTLMALGIAPSFPGPFYALDPNSGEILLVDTTARDVISVNSNLKVFIEFLSGFTQFMLANPDPQGRAGAAEVLRLWMTMVDPPAMDSTTSDPKWWPDIIGQLTG